MKLTTRLFLIVLLGLLPLVGMEAYNAYALHMARRVEVEQQAVRQARLTSSELERLIEGIRGILVSVSEADVVQRENSADCSAYLGRLLKKMPYLTSMATTDISGQVVCSTNSPNWPISILDRTYFQEALDTTAAVVGEYIVGKVSNVPLLPVAIAVRTPAGRPMGVAVATLDLGWLSDHLKQRGYPDGGSVTVSDRDGTIIARHPFPDRFIGTKIPAEFRYLLRLAEAGSLEVVSQDGTRRILGYVPVNQSQAGLYVSTGLSSQELFASLTDAAWRQFGITAVSLALAFVGMAVASVYFLRKPVDAIVSAARSWREGNMSARTHLKDDGSEFGQIGAEFDRTIEKLNAGRELISVLMRELSHRGKNQITLILAMTNQISKQASSVEEFKAALRQRLMALAASQELHRDVSDDRIELANILQAQLRVFSAENDNRLTFSGSPLQVDAETGRLLGMAFHELLTNAEKYGALSSDQGKVTISWSTDEAGMCHIVWHELNGPAVTPPQSSGFGRLLIDKIIPMQLGGATKLTFAQSGVRWHLSFRA